MSEDWLPYIDVKLDCGLGMHSLHSRIVLTIWVPIDHGQHTDWQTISLNVQESAVMVQELLWPRDDEDDEDEKEDKGHLVKHGNGVHGARWMLEGRNLKFNTSHTAITWFFTTAEITLGDADVRRLAGYLMLWAGWNMVGSRTVVHPRREEKILHLRDERSSSHE